MDTSALIAALVLLASVAFFAGRSRSVDIATASGGISSLNSLPFYYGSLAAIWCLVPSFTIVLAWLLFDEKIIAEILSQSFSEAMLTRADGHATIIVNQVYNVALGNVPESYATPEVVAAAERLRSLLRINQWALTIVALLSASLGALLIWKKITPQFKARVQVETVFRRSLFCCSAIAVLTTIGIVLSVLFESLHFFTMVPINEFLFGYEWSPQISLRQDQQGSSGKFGALPLFAGTLLIAFIALCIAVPSGLMAAIYLSEYASKRTRAIMKPALEVLAGVPTVVYGFFAALTVAPFIRQLGINLGLDHHFAISSESALAAGLVMGVMIIPFISSLADDVISAVPQALRDGSLALGSTQSEMIKKVVIPAALPGIVGGVLLATSRAIGETMIVVMAAGLAANLSLNPFDSVTTVTVQIVTLLVGDQEFDSPKTLAAFALGLMLFIVTLTLNFFALHVVKKYREQYE